MYAAKFAVFSIITVIAALASASPVPVAAPEAALDPVLAKTELLAVGSFMHFVRPLLKAFSSMKREPLPVAEAVAVPEVEDVEERICRFGCL
ncbi:hypothetical protein EDC04DRAFT_3096666 [Pisolithus marmoratus]|nr:hypothetical protein EDC04DRAFT_3096666 [Pisolithus marmoratus]